MPGGDGRPGGSPGCQGGDHTELRGEARGSDERAGPGRPGDRAPAGRAGEQGAGPERQGHWGPGCCGRHRPHPLLGKSGASLPGLKCEGSSYAYRKRVPASHEEAGSSARVDGACTMLMTLSDFWARERILRAARACCTTKFQGPKVSFFPDLSLATHARRQRLVALKQAFVKEGAQVYVLYPAKLKVLCRGQTYVFRDCTSAARLLDEIRQERLTMALIRNRLGLLVLGVLVTFVLYLLLPAIQHERFTSRAGSHKAQARAEEKGQQDVNVTVLTGTIAGSPSILFREGFLLQRAGTPSPKRLEVVFLHGQAFTSKTWEDLGTLTLLSEEGYRSVAIDLPGYGNSPLSDSVSTEQGRVAFLLRVLKELGIQRPVLISPSMSGHYSVPFVLVHGAQLKGFVPIAPVGTQEYTAQQYQQVQTPTLIIYGERDSGLGTQSLQSLQQLPKHKVVVLPDAGHACYLEKPREFHEVLLAFLGELQ
ncbi:unnamed protein product [Natator depressus]